VGATIEFTRPDGGKAPGYLATASAGAPGVVMFEEWWGVNAQIRETADRLAGDGFAVLVPDLFRGRIAENREEAGHMMEGLSFGDAATQDAVGAGNYLRAHGSAKVGIMGFCMGGAVALLAAMHAPQAFDAVLTFYGMPPAEAGDPGKIRVPVMGHWALSDAFFDISGVEALEAKLKAAGVPPEFHRYEAGHAFYNPGGIGNYNREAAETAWQRTVDFFKRTLR
jgi:carboxymethylenebutenolidase